MSGTIKVNNVFACQIFVKNGGALVATIPSESGQTISVENGDEITVNLDYSGSITLNQNEVTDEPAADFTSFTFGLNTMSFVVNLDPSGKGLHTGDVEPDISVGKDGIPPSEV
jgi:hypothetical protein